MLIQRLASKTAAVFALIALSTGCGSSATTSTAPSPLVRCALTLNVGIQTLPPEGGSGAISVGATRECTWTVAVEGAWLSLKSGQSGQGDGTVEFTAAANPDPVARRGALVLNNQRAEVTQAAGECSVTLAESSASFTPTGGPGRVDVRASSALCSWSASSDQPWIAIRSGAEGRGNASVLFDVAPTTGPPRTGTIAIGEQRFSITQSEGCTYTINPANVAAPPEGRNGTVAITTSAPACPWTASSNVGWVSFARTTGTGPGSLAFTIQPTGGPSRTGTAVIAGHVFTVTQSPGCSFQVQPLAHSVPPSGGNGTIAVTTPPGCEWTAASESPWIALEGVTTGRGGGAVNFVVPATSGPARSGSIMVAGQRVSVTQGPGCTYSITPTQESVPSSGGGGRVNVATTEGCGWTAATTASAPWITITSGASGTGNGAVQYTAGATNGPARSGTMTIAGHTFTVNQGQGCTFNLNPTNATVPDAGGRIAFDVQTAGGCGWTASTQTPWITFASGASGSGNGTVQLNIAANSGPPRTGTASVADKTFTVTQGSGCTIALSAPGQSVPATGASGSVGVTAGQGCTWTATSNAPLWLSITDTGAGNGNGNVAFAVALNNGPERSGTLTIGGQTFTVTQGGGCTFTVAPELLASPAGGGPARVEVSSGSECAWTAGSSVPWVTLNGDGNFRGTVSLELSVAPNIGPARSGTLTIAGRTVTVNQESGCTFAINPTSVNVPAQGGTGSINVSAAQGCTWTAESRVGWIHVSPNTASGSGDGVVQGTVEPNLSGVPRSGTVIIAGHTLTVTQQ